jgi:hypothetical protein
LWNIISALNIGAGATKIVIGTKPLHHLYSRACPPMHRQYTLRVFFERANMNQGAHDRSLWRGPQ